MATAILELQKLTKLYPGGRGVRDVDLTVHEGEMFGFIGPNGAGKSTTIRALLGLLRPTSGRALLLGIDAVADGVSARAHVGYLPSEPQLPDGATVARVLADAGAFFPIDTRQRRAELCAAFDLDPRRNADDLSLGNKKKVALVAALQHAPRLLILDEPTNGLDPLIQARLFEVLAAERARGATVFFSSHVLAEVERVCERVALIKDGRLVEVARVDSLVERQVRRVRARLPSADAPSTAARLPGVTGLHREASALRFVYAGPAPALLAALAADAVIDVVIEQPSLEEIVLGRYETNGTNGTNGTNDTNPTSHDAARVRRVA